MPFKACISLGPDRFYNVEADMTPDTFLISLLHWLHAAAADPDPAALDRLRKDTQQIDRSADAIGAMADNLARVAPDASHQE